MSKIAEMVRQKKFPYITVILIVLKKTGVFSRLHIRMPKIFRKKNQNE